MASICMYFNYFLALLLMLIIGCSDSSGNGGNTDTGNTDPDSGSTDDTATGDTESANPSDTATADTASETPNIESVALYAQKLTDSTGALRVSNGVPFPKGVVTDVNTLALFDGDTELDNTMMPLAVWPDGSLRSVLLQFMRDAADFPATLTLHLNTLRGVPVNNPFTMDWIVPDAVAFPDAEYLSDSGVMGPMVAAGTEAWMSDYDANQGAEFLNLTGDDVWTNDCREDGYYSTTLTWYAHFVRSGDIEAYQWARQEAVHYRDDQIGADGRMAGREEPRYLYLKAMEADYLLSGDYETKQVAEVMADYLLNTWDADFFFFAHDDEHFWTERRAAFALLGLIVYGRFSGSVTHLDATHDRLENILLTQAEWDLGGFIHHLYAHDPDECGVQGSYGGSPFMTGLMFETLIAYYEWFGNDAIITAVADACDWLWEEGWGTSGFDYMIGCDTGTGEAPDLNLLIAHGFAFAWHHTREQRFYDRGMEIFNQGVSEAYLGTRKHYNQNYRSSSAFLYYMTQ